MIYSHTGLRGIAAITILIGHISKWHPPGIPLDARFFDFFQTHGIVVDFFFILSGFVLNWVYGRPGTSFCWPSFFRARVARLVPLYFLTLAVLLPQPLFSMSRHGLEYLPKDFYISLVSSMLMLSGVIDGWHLTINHTAWSICVEFVCCLALFPLLVRTNKFFDRYPRLIWILPLLVFGCIHVIVLSHEAHPALHARGEWDYTWLLYGVFGLSAGFFLCTFYRKTWLWRPGLPLTNLTCLLAVLICCLSRSGSLPESSFLYVSPFLLYFTVADSGVVAAAMKIPFLQWLGERAYSICLWNYPIILLMRSTFGGKAGPFHAVHGLLPAVAYSGAVVVAALLVSELSFHYFEAPCREYLRNPGGARRSS